MQSQQENPVAMRNNLGRFLLMEHPARWVPTAALMDSLGVKSERELRGNDSPLYNEAISKVGAYCHVSRAETHEWLTYKHRILRHALSELRRLRRMEKARRAVAWNAVPYNVEPDTGQMRFI
jgi:hypothetical protein